MMTVRLMALARTNSTERTEQIFHANWTGFDSFRSGQKRSKKNAAPKMVATNTPAKMLYEKDPMMSLFAIFAVGYWFWMFCCSF